jgi:nitrate reductase gamma subunit
MSLNLFAFGIYPYIALAIFFIGTWARYDREQYTWKASSSQILEKKWLRRGSIPFHIGILGILAGHTVGLLTPAAVWYTLGIGAPAKQMLAMVAGGAFGVLMFVGLTILILRRLLHPRVRASSSKMDIFILFMLYAQLLLGLGSIFVSAGHPDGTEMILLMTWAQSIVTFQAMAAAEAISSVHWIYKAHVFLGLTLFLVVPFSRLVHVFSVPIEYLTRRYQIVRRRGPWQQKPKPVALQPRPEVVAPAAPTIEPAKPQVTS